MVKEAVGERAAELFVEEYEHEGDPGSFFGEPVGIAFAVAFQQSVRLHFAEVVAKLIQSVSVGGDTERCKRGGVDVFARPASFLRRIGNDDAAHLLLAFLEALHKDAVV